MRKVSACDLAKNKTRLYFYGVMYSGVECDCGVTLSIYPHQASIGLANRTLWVRFPLWSGRFFSLPVWIYTQSNTTITPVGKLQWNKMLPNSQQSPWV